MNEYEQILKVLDTRSRSDIYATREALRDLLVILARRERELLEAADRSVGG